MNLAESITRITWNSSWRERTWSDLDQPWDVIVIGGGITGAGILREATRAGLRVLLVEAHDFASGTSSRSSKLVHGGFRYLRNAQLRITLESVRERDRLLREGKGLINRLGFLFTGLENDSLPLWTIGLGLLIYDLLAFRWQHKYYDASELRTLCPPLSAPGLRGGYRYFDALTDDARLVLRLIREAVAEGATALNYAQVESLLQTRSGDVCGVVLQDYAPGGESRTVELKASVVINATGAWADALRKRIGQPPQLRTLRGSHLVLPRDRLPLTRAVSFWHPADGRAVFAIPWEGVTLMGTTDVDHPPPITQDPCLSDGEADYLLAGLDQVFPALALKSDDVLAAYAGVRAVIDTGKADPSKESREHILWNEKGLLTVSGGKLTTFRLMAFDVLRMVRAALPDHFQPSRSHGVLDPIPEERLSAADGLSPPARLRLFGRYGGEAEQLLASTPVSEHLALPGSETIRAEISWAARMEGVVHLDDLLLRRVRLGLTLPEGGLESELQLRNLIQPAMGWDDSMWQIEAQNYKTLLASCYRLG